MHMTSTEYIWLTAVASIVGTATVFLLWTCYTRRAHRGEHGRHDPNNSPAAVTAEVVKTSHGRHAAPEPATPRRATGRATAA